MIPFASVAETETPEGQEALNNAITAVRDATNPDPVEIVTVSVNDLDNVIERYGLEDAAQSLLDFARANPQGVIVVGIPRWIEGIVGVNREDYLDGRV